MELTETKVLNSLKGVPEPTVRRMPQYLTYLKNLKAGGSTSVSAPLIAKDLKIDSTQVTKDFSYTGITGKPRIGYNIEELIEALKEFLGYNRSDLGFLVGAGNLGSALINYNGFKDIGLRIVAAFDICPKKVGTTVNGLEVFHIDKFRNLAERLHVSIGIITTPENVAQQVADMMIGWGIKAVWNFTPALVKVPENIILENTSIYSNLAVIFNKLNKV